MLRTFPALPGSHLVTSSKAYAVYPSTNTKAQIIGGDAKKAEGFNQAQRLESPESLPVIDTNKSLSNPISPNSTEGKI